MRLIHEPTGRELKIGAMAVSFRGVVVTITGFDERRVYCRDEKGTTYEWFPSVIGARIITF